MRTHHWMRIAKLPCTVHNSFHIYRKISVLVIVGPSHKTLTQARGARPTVVDSIMVDGKAANIAIQPIPNDSLTTYTHTKFRLYAGLCYSATNGVVVRAPDAKLGANGVVFRPGFDGTAPGPPNPEKSIIFLIPLDPESCTYQSVLDEPGASRPTCRGSHPKVLGSGYGSDDT